MSGCHSLSFPGQVVSCVHGIGHGVFVWKGDVPTALAECDILGKGDQLYCFDGVFMEYFANSMNLNIVSGKSAESKCFDFEKRHQSQCIRNQTLFLLNAEVNDDYGRIIKSCDGMSDHDNRDQCIRTSGL